MHPGKRISRISSITCLLGIPTLACAQQLSQELPTAPSGFSRTTWTPEPMSDMESIIDRLQIRANLSGTYDSNVTQGSGDEFRPVDEAFIVGLGGNFAYTGKGAAWSYSAAYNFNYEQYSGERSDLSGLNNQGGNISLGYEGGKISLSGYAGFSVNDGANRFYDEVIEQTTFNYGLTGEYTISPKTSIIGSLKQQFNETSGPVNVDYSTLDASISAIWKWSSLTQFGPGIRYTLTTGDNWEDRYTIGPTLSLNYKLSSKVSFRSRVGLDFVEYDGGGSGDPLLSTQIGADYRANSLWGLNATLFRDARPDPITPGAYDQLTSFRIGYYRQIRRVTVNIGAGYELTEREDNGNSDGQADREYLTWDASASMPMFSNRILGSVFYKYRDYKNDSTYDWHGSQVGFSLTTEF